MPTLFSILGLVFVLLSTMTYSVNSTVTRMNQADDTIRIEQMIAYQSLVDAYAKTHPTTSGTVSDGSLAIPGWLVRPVGVTNTITGARGYAWFTPDGVGIGMRIAERAQGQGSARAGVKINGRLQQPGATTAGAVLPAAIPDGAVVVMRS